MKQRIVLSLELSIAPHAVDETGNVWILDFGKQKHHPLAHEYMNGLLHNMTHFFSAKKSIAPTKNHRSQRPRSTKLPCNVKCIGTIARVAGPWRIGHSDSVGRKRLALIISAKKHAETITGRLNHPHLGTANTRNSPTAPKNIRFGCLAVWKFNRETLGPIVQERPNQWFLC